MKNKLFAFLAMSFLAAANSSLSTARAQGTAFTYQGRLNVGGSPANGLYDYRFKLYVDPLGNTQVGSSYLTNAIPVTNGLFTTTIDFGPGIFTSGTNWLEVDVKTNLAGSYTVLNPFQQVTPTPNAIFAETANNLSGTVASASLSGTYGSAVTLNNAGNSISGSFTGNGANVTNVNAAMLNGLGAANFWQLSGNNVTTGQFLGSTNNQPVEIWANGTRALRLEPNATAPNVIGGSVANSDSTTPGVVGATIGGGIYNTNVSSYAFVGGGQQNNIQPNAAFSVLVGGQGNSIQLAAYDSVLIGGDNNSIAQSLNDWEMAAFLGGGWGNSIGNYSINSFLGGGSQNSIQTQAAGTVLVGGQNNSIQYQAFSSFLGGGYQNSIQSNSANCFLGGGVGNSIQGGAYSGWSASYPSFNGTAYRATWTATGSGMAAFLGGGSGNNIQFNAVGAFLGGGFQNTIQSNASYSVIGGGTYNLIGTDVTNSFIVGGVSNSIAYPANYSAIGGGQLNSILGVNSTIAGGAQNQIKYGSGAGFIGGGSGNIIDTSSQFSTIAGGVYNYIAPSAGAGAIGGGQGNNINGSAGFATIPGGYGNVVGASANYSLAAGYYASAAHPGSFVWCDGSVAANTASIAANSWTARVTGGARFISAVNGSGTPTAGVTLASGGGSWTSLSDRNAKENFSDVDAKNILAKVAAMPVLTWNYKTQPAAIRHIGPMAQDFKAAFNVGETDTGITTVDEGGVALAAIQGLNQKVEEKNATIQEQSAQIADLKTRLEKLEQLMTEKLGGAK